MDPWLEKLDIPCDPSSCSKKFFGSQSPWQNAQGTCKPWNLPLDQSRWPAVGVFTSQLCSCSARLLTVMAVPYRYEEMWRRRVGTDLLKGSTKNPYICKKYHWDLPHYKHRSIMISIWLLRLMKNILIMDGYYDYNDGYDLPDISIPCKWTSSLGVNL